ncbi:response regulator [uncultured Desulfosarcina sp.]|uniref:response regulator n=1 Tax=uncultured Desulfosarcina sp. TaxID=218289 RepID=UPI0029C89595|nr:response regulator [uncultured Desulfosarcina sp.]
MPTITIYFMPKPKPTHNNPTVLIAEDDHLITKAYVASLKRSGFKTIHASDGLEALWESKRKNPDIILLDIKMPFINGFKVLKELKANPKTKDIPVLLLSNSLRDEYLVSAQSLGAKEFLIKLDLSIDTLVQKIMTYTKEHTAPA